MSAEPIAVDKIKLRSAPWGGDPFWIASDVDDDDEMPIAVWSDWVALARRILEREMNAYTIGVDKAMTETNDSAFQKALREEAKAMDELIATSPPLILDDGKGRAITVTKEWLARIVDDFEETSGDPPKFFHAEPDGTMVRCTPECVAEHLDSARTTLRMRTEKARRNFKRRRKQWREDHL